MGHDSWRPLPMDTWDKARIDFTGIKAWPGVNPILTVLYGGCPTPLSPVWETEDKYRGQGRTTRTSADGFSPFHLSSPWGLSGDRGGREMRKSCQRQATQQFQLCISVHLSDPSASFLQCLCLIFLHIPFSAAPSHLGSPSGGSVELGIQSFHLSISRVGFQIALLGRGVWWAVCIPPSNCHKIVKPGWYCQAETQISCTSSDLFAILCGFYLLLGLAKTTKQKLV